MVLWVVANCSWAEDEDAWPHPAMPASLTLFDIAGTVTVNGLPMRIQGFVSPMTQGQLAAEFRRSLGMPLVEKSIGDRLILGRAQGAYYLTVQIDATGTGARGTVGMTRLDPASGGQQAFSATRAWWIARMPAETRLVSLVASEDRGRHSRYFVFANRHSVALNVDYLKRVIAQEGLEQERTAPLDGAAIKKALTIRKSPVPSSGQLLFFKGGRKGAEAAIFRSEDGETTLALNIVLYLDDSR